MFIFAATVLFSAFLLFALQPMVAKFLLPSFGGTAAVWTTCQVVFQTLLLAGYAYAHLLRTKLSAVAQRWTHLGVLSVSLLFLPPAPAVTLAASTSGTPVWALLRCLLTSIGVPFFALSATAPLLMEWYRQTFPGHSPNRLYAFSNAGSLLALIGYPAVLELSFSRTNQARLWAGGMGLFLAMCAALAWRSAGKSRDRGGARDVVERAPTTGKEAPGSRWLSDSHRVPSNPSIHQSTNPLRSRQPMNASRQRLWLWIALPACGSALLLALTNQISQDVAPTPLLWVAPLSVYLLTFILCFEGPGSYRRGVFLPGCLLALLALAWLFYYACLQTLAIQVGGYLAVLFVSCMVCHGELYRLRPEPEHLTAYYLCIAAGGAVGGMFVGILAPLVFNNVYETPLAGAFLAGLVTFLLWREGAPLPVGGRTIRLGPVALAATLGVMASLGAAVWGRGRQSIYSTRSFYGVCQVKEGTTWLINNVPCPLSYGRGRMLVSGQVYHGFQFMDGPAASFPTTYYSPESGLGIALAGLPVRMNRRIGAIGLGVGTLAAYGKAGDRIRFYELNPDVARIARKYFTFLKNSAASVEVVLGDGRLSLERGQAEQYDLLVVDAFSGDSIPTHLLTDEAMRTYLRRLGPNGVIAVHISNDHLDLRPVVRGLATSHGMRWLTVPPADLDPSTGKLGATWMLLSSSDAFFSQPIIAECLAKSADTDRRLLLWTDDRSSILPILQ